VEAKFKSKNMILDDLKRINNYIEVKKLFLTFFFVLLTAVSFGQARLGSSESEIIFSLITFGLKTESKL